MAAQIGRQDMPVAAQRRRDPIPVAAMVAPAMHEQQRRRGWVTPIDIVQSQTLREVNPRGWSGAVEICGHDISAAAKPPMRGESSTRPARVAAETPLRGAVK